MASSWSSEESHGNEMKCRVDFDQSRFMEGWATLPRPVADFGRYLTILWLVEWNQRWFFVMTVRKAASRPAGSKQGFQDTLKVYWSGCLHWNSSKFHFQWSYFSVLDLSIIVYIICICICICMHFTSHICCPWITWYRNADESLAYRSQASWVGKSQKRPICRLHIWGVVLSHVTFANKCMQECRLSARRKGKKRKMQVQRVSWTVWATVSVVWHGLGAVVQYLSPKVRRKLKTCTLSTCVFSPQIPVWRFSFFMRHDESKWGKKKASASASIVACTPHLHGFSRVRGLQHWRQKIKRQALGKMLVRCKVFDWRLAKVRRPEAYSFAPRNYSFAVIRWGW